MSLPSMLTLLGSHPHSRLIISLDNLLQADDTRAIGLDLVRSYARAADPEVLTRGQNHLIGRFRHAVDILSGDVQLGGLSYETLRENIRQAGGTFEDEETDTEARGLVAAIVEGEPALGWLVADRYEQKIRTREPGYRGGPDLEDHIQDIRRTLASDPDGYLAVSLDNLTGSDTGSRLGIDQVTDFVRLAAPEDYPGQLGKDVARLKRAAAILRDEITLGGLTYFNLRANVYGLMGSLGNFATSTEARDIARRIIAGAPALAAEIAGREPEVVRYD
ncbi:MAG TPA: hypothetical protein VF885_12865 [Arthrobacter sp.]